ncbi:SMI1/KNR4 family protein [Kitasatospora kifunensis]|uniref:Knr4/Smi1-like domain-containing protein n=1 Tax=Kitasatospora kifunensis TaxID=58351 RepID=A0A7W7RB16_KITKI|nr:SMI1/KNR4 family protein [Kitasatospora kifunensis]MBB4928629.1 hypothetical protein [Kitasatospora kifunensis]
MEPALCEAEVASAEEELGISLPSAYRTFLLEVGAGGAGAHYGIFPLRHDKEGWHWDEGRSYRSDNTLLAQAFPSAAERTRRQEELNAREPAEQDFPDHRSYLAAFHAWDDEWEQLDASMTAGAIHLSHQGCGYFTWLVVNGPERDTLFTDPRAADRTLEPLTAGPHRVDFGGWYLSQLTRATSEAQRGPRQLASRRRVRE